MSSTFFKWEATKEAQARVISAGLENQPPDVSRAIAEAEVTGKGRYDHSFYAFLTMTKTFHFTSPLLTPFIPNASHLLVDADKKPADSLTKLAALDVDNLLVKTQGISKGVLFHVQQALLKEWGPDSLGVLLEDTMQELLTGVIFQLFSVSHDPCFPFFILILTYTIILIISFLSLFPYFQGLSLLELAVHLEEKAAQLRHEGLGQIKIPLAGTDMSSLLDILQGHFGHTDSSESAESANESEKVLTTKEKTSEIVEKILVKPTEAGHLATAELVYPFKSSPLVVAGILKMYLPLHGPKTLS